MPDGWQWQEEEGLAAARNKALRKEVRSRYYSL
jgi:hypothetical protein